MSAADLNDLPKLVALFVERAVQPLQRGNKTILELLGRADVDDRWNHVVARLAHVDVIVGMDGFA